MKRVLLLISFFSIVQAIRAQTTDEIYNYITSGYITTVQQGLDFKKGYNSKEITKSEEFKGTISNNTYQFSYRTFYRENEPKNILAFMIVLYKNGQVFQSFCLPSSNSEGKYWTAFYKDISSKLVNDQREKMFINIAQLFTLNYKSI